MKDISESRKNIEDIDRQMAALFEKRMQCSHEIAEYKKAKGIPVFDSSREKSLIEKNEAYIVDTELKPYYRQFMKDIMDISKQYQRSLYKEETSKIKIRVINGPNINMLGIREPDIYGKITYKELVRLIEEKKKKKDVYVEVMQSNHEGDLVDMLQDCYGKADGIVINPGACTHTSVAILDALKAISVPAVEVHISEVDKREDFRQISYIRQACMATITGHGVNGYLEAIDMLKENHNAK